MDDVSYLQLKEQNNRIIENLIKDSTNTSFRFTDKNFSNKKIYSTLVTLLVFLVMYLSKPSFIMNKDEEDEKINYVKYIGYSILLSSVLVSLIFYMKF